MQHRHRLPIFSVVVRRGVLALGFSSVTGLGLWACVDVLEDDSPTSVEADERVRAARADAELERILVQVREGDDDDRLAHNNRLHLVLVGPGDTRPDDHPVYLPEESLADGLDLDDLLDAATRRFGAGIANFGHGGSEVVFNDRQEAEQLRFELTTDGTADFTIRPWVDIADFFGPAGQDFAFERVPLGTARDAVLDGYPGTRGSALEEVGMVEVPETEFGVALNVGYNHGRSWAWDLDIHYGDDEAARLRILAALGAHLGVVLDPNDPDGNYRVPTRDGSHDVVNVTDFHDGFRAVTVFRSTDDVPTD